MTKKKEFKNCYLLTILIYYEKESYYYNEHLTLFKTSMIMLCSNMKLKKNEINVSKCIFVPSSLK